MGNREDAINHEQTHIDGAHVAAPTRPGMVTLQTLIDAYLEEYEVREFRINIARCRVAHLRAHFGATTLASDITTYGIRQYQVARRQHGAASATINRETSALNRMFRLVTGWGWLETGPMFPVGCASARDKDSLNTAIIWRCARTSPHRSKTFSISRTTPGGGNEKS
jgi:hypothetical protein